MNRVFGLGVYGVQGACRVCICFLFQLAVATGGQDGRGVACWEAIGGYIGIHIDTTILNGPVCEQPVANGQLRTALLVLQYGTSLV